jgi:hypothetical protein
LRLPLLLDSNCANAATRLLWFRWTSGLSRALLFRSEAGHGSSRPNPAGDEPWRGPGGATDDVAYLGGPSDEIQIEIQTKRKVSKRCQIWS